MPQSSSVLITGCASGFGQLIAQTLVSEGYKVIATMRDPDGLNKDAKQQLCHFAQGKAGSLEVLALDVTRDDSIQSVVDYMLHHYKSIDIVVNNAGLGCLGIMESFSMPQIEQVFAVNTLGPIRVNHAVLPTMRQQKDGLIIHISSAAGRLCFPFLGVYNASKFALEAFVESYRYELMPFGIETCAIEPGAFPSELHNKRLQPAHNEILPAYGPIAQIPDQMVAAMLHLMNSETPPNPQAIADAVLDLIQTPKGQRPLRTVVGEIATTGITQLNDFQAQMQQALLQSMQPS